MTMSLSVEEKMQYCSGNTYSLFSFGEPIGQYQPIVATTTKIHDSFLELWGAECILQTKAWDYGVILNLTWQILKFVQK